MVIRERIEVTSLSPSTASEKSMRPSHWQFEVPGHLRLAFSPGDVVNTVYHCNSALSALSPRLELTFSGSRDTVITVPLVDHIVSESSDEFVFCTALVQWASVLGGEVDLGLVAAGDRIDPVYYVHGYTIPMTGPRGATIPDHATENADGTLEWGGGNWGETGTPNDIGHSNHFIDYYGLLETTTAVRLLSQDDEPLDEEYVMVSNVPTEWELDDAPLPFEANDYYGTRYEAYDPDTYRPEVIGLDPTAEVRFCVETLSRDGGAFDGQRTDCTKADNRFNGIPDPEGSGTFRGALHLRLVSDEVDDGRGFTHDARQTYRVRLRDEVRVTAEVLDDDTDLWEAVADTLFAVGAPPFTDAGQPNPSPDAVRRVGLAWHADEDVNVDAEDADSTTARITRQYAQAALYMERREFQTFDADSVVTNALHFVFTADTTSEAGSIEITGLVGGQSRLCLENGR